MRTENDNTETSAAQQQAGDLRSRLADAINRIVVMSEFETDEMVEVVLATLAYKEPPKGSREWMVCDLARAIIDSTIELSGSISDVEIGSRIIGIEEAAKAIRCMVADKGNGADKADVSRRSTTYYHNPFDDLTLSLSQAENLIQTIIDAEMQGEDRDLVGLGAMVRREIETARSLCLENSKQWHGATGGAA